MAESRQNKCPAIVRVLLVFLLKQACKVSGSIKVLWQQDACEMKQFTIDYLTAAFQAAGTHNGRFSYPDSV
jgi:hypothetical protein